MTQIDLKILSEYQVPDSTWRAYEFRNGKKVMVRPSNSSSQHLTYTTFVSGNLTRKDCEYKSRIPGRILEDNEDRRRIVAKRSLAIHLIKKNGS